LVLSSLPMLMIRVIMRDMSELRSPRTTKLVLEVKLKASRSLRSV
jgi:hypothetical protein